MKQGWTIIIYEQLFICIHIVILETKDLNTHKYFLRMKKGDDGMKNGELQPTGCCQVVHEDVVNKAKARMPQEDNLYDLAELFKVFGDTTRIKIIWALFESEMCVCDIACLLGMTQSAISHQLRVLKTARLVRYRKSGKTVYYSLNDEHVQKIFDMGMQHILE